MLVQERISELVETAAEDPKVDQEYGAEMYGVIEVLKQDVLDFKACGGAVPGCGACEEIPGISGQAQHVPRGGCIDGACGAEGRDQAPTTEGTSVAHRHSGSSATTMHR